MPELLYTYSIYILSNKNRTTFYIGVTNVIKRRVLEHKSGKGSSFTTKCNLTDLMYHEEFDDVRLAIQREKQLKNWHRDWKINLIKNINPAMEDIASDWFALEMIKEYKNKKDDEQRDAETSSA